MHIFAFFLFFSIIFYWVILMDKNCGSCTYLDLTTGDIYGRYYCKKKYDRHKSTDNICYSYTKAYSRSSGEYHNAIDYSKNKDSSACYLTTMMCSILKINDSNYYLNTLRDFRNNYLKNNCEYRHLLVEYDIVGPIISKYLIEDKNNKLIAAKMFYNYIKPVVSLIEDKMYKDAIVRYMMMVNSLKSIYGINTFISIEEIRNCDISLSGHGKYIKKYS